MESELPVGYWFKGYDDAGRIRIGFLYGGHMGGECEIYLPKNKLDKFNADDEWRRETKNRFFKVVYLAAPELNVPIPADMGSKDGIVPESWE
jgi:hypothetical protein